MWLELFTINPFFLFAGVLHPVEIRIKKKFKKIWTYFKWYVYTPYWHWIYLPLFGRYRLVRKPARRYKRSAIAAFWAFVAAVERSPEVMGSALKTAYSRTKFALLRIPGMRTAVNWFKIAMRAYFKVVNFRRLLIACVIADMFIYHWTEQGIDKDLRIWNICMLTIFFNVLYLLMDGADGKLRLFSHDIITRLYFKKYLKITPGTVLTPEQMKDPFISKYIRFRHMRNAYLCIFGFLYMGQPLFRP